MGSTSCNTVELLQQLDKWLNSSDWTVDEEGPDSQSLIEFLSNPPPMGFHSRAPAFLELNVDPKNSISIRYDTNESLLFLTLNVPDEMVELKGDYIGMLANLICLQINGGKTLKCLPNAITRLHNLKCLVIKGCCSLQELPLDLNKLVNLKELCLWDCGISSLPNTITELLNLQVLELKRCFVLEQLPATFNNLIGLTKLSISDCGIKCLPKDTITGLHRLKVLDLKNCYDLQDLLENLHQLLSLTELRISNSDIKSLPSSITSLQNVEIIDLDCCPFLQELPPNLNELVNLRQLCVRHCDMIKSLPCIKVPSLHQGAIVSDLSIGIPMSTNFPNFNISLAPHEHKLIENHLMDYTRDLAETESLLPLQNRLTDMENQQGFAAFDQDKVKAAVSDNAAKPVGGGHHTLENGTSEKNPLGVQKIVKLRQQISAEDIQQCQRSRMTMNDAMKHLGVKRSSLKRRLKDLDIQWQTSNKGVKYSTLPNVVQQNANSTTFDVKATYGENLARFGFSFTHSPSVGELQKEVAKNLDIELSKFKMKYKDDEEEWMILTRDSHLDCALSQLKSSGTNILRLLVIRI